MAHFAELDPNNIVLRVVVVANNDCLDPSGVESEAVGIHFCQQLFGEHTSWKQTSYNSNIRKNYAGIGYTYDNRLDAFISPQPFPSWSLNEETCDWEPPVPYPDTTEPLIWNETDQTWQSPPVIPNDNNV
jgi:hypothetical protein